MTAKEYRGWEDHFADYPPGDYHVQKILAELRCDLIQFFSGKRPPLYDMAPQLEPLRERRARLIKQHKERQAALTQQVTDAYRRHKREGSTK